MKNSLRLLAAALAIFAGASAFAQDSGPTTPPAHGRHHGPPFVVNSDGTLTLPDGTVIQPNADGTFTLPDGDVIDPNNPPPPGPPFTKNADGSITLRDGTVIQPNADGTYTLPDGHVIDLTKAPPAGGPGRGRGPKGPPPSGG